MDDWTKTKYQHAISMAQHQSFWKFKLLSSPPLHYISLWIFITQIEKMKRASPMRHQFLCFFPTCKNKPKTVLPLKSKMETYRTVADKSHSTVSGTQIHVTHDNTVHFLFFCVGSSLSWSMKKVDKTVRSIRNGDLSNFQKLSPILIGHNRVCSFFFLISPVVFLPVVSDSEWGGVWVSKWVQCPPRVSKGGESLDQLTWRPVLCPWVACSRCSSEHVTRRSFLPVSGSGPGETRGL